MAANGFIGLDATVADFWRWAFSEFSGTRMQLRAEVAEQFRLAEQSKREAGG